METIVQSQGLPDQKIQSKSGVGGSHAKSRKQSVMSCSDALSTARSNSPLQEGAFAGLNDG